MTDNRDPANRPDNWKAMELREFEKGTRKIDLRKDFRDQNQGLLKNYGRDRYTYTAELTNASHKYWKENEARWAHGYPATAWL